MAVASKGKNTPDLFPEQNTEERERGYVSPEKGENAGFHRRGSGIRA